MYTGDSLDSDDICLNADITTTMNSPGFQVIKKLVTCNTDENSIFLGSINVALVRQNPSTLIHDMLFNDLRGQAI
ncbi:MAG: hypothetical protein H7196_01595 [candidate division SR1 bacterium]|nr:hypothetical protein [candidate division SR1 bacterium]